MELIKQFVKKRLDKYASTLEFAKRSYNSAPKNSVTQESWAGRVQELQGRMEELRIIFNKLNRLT